MPSSYEYGTFAIDDGYMAALAALFRRLGADNLLFTCEGADNDFFNSSALPGALHT